MITWGSFGFVHMMTFLAAIVLILGLYLVLRRCSPRVQILVLGLLSFSGIGAIIFNLVTWGSPVEYLPLHLCSLTAMALPIAVFTRSRRLCNLLLLWSLGAIMAIVVNTAQADIGSVIRVNYMYSITPPNPVLEMFWQLIPHSYWYMLLTLPIILVYLAAIYAPELRRMHLFRRVRRYLTPLF